MPNALTNTCSGDYNLLEGKSIIKAAVLLFCVDMPACLWYDDFLSEIFSGNMARRQALFSLWKMILPVTLVIYVICTIYADR